MTTGRHVHIHYLRPPDHEELFVQELLLDTEEVKITLARDLEFDPPLRIHDRVALETGSNAVWFTFPGRWHDIGRFHRADGAFTGFYANVITPPKIGPSETPDAVERWDVTDLYLDLWMPPGQEPALLDRDELEEARKNGWIEPATGERATREGVALLADAEAGNWPPEVVKEWTLERALAAQSSSSSSSSPPTR